jgi:hypothetical protein
MESLLPRTIFNWTNAVRPIREPGLSAIVRFVTATYVNRTDTFDAIYASTRGANRLGAIGGAGTRGQAEASGEDHEATESLGAGAWPNQTDRFA